MIASENPSRIIVGFNRRQSGCCGISNRPTFSERSIRSARSSLRTTDIARGHGHHGRAALHLARPGTLEPQYVPLAAAVAAVAGERLGRLPHACSEGRRHSWRRQGRHQSGAARPATAGLRGPPPVGSASRQRALPAPGMPSALRSWQLPSRASAWVRRRDEARETAAPIGGRWRCRNRRLAHAARASALARRTDACAAPSARCTPTGSSA